MATLSLKNINKIYPNGTQAVFDFNLEIKDKEFIRRSIWMWKVNNTSYDRWS